MTLFILMAVLGLFLGIYAIFYMYLSSRVKKQEQILVGLFLDKTSKIPALIEVMRPYVIKPEAFAEMIHLHTRVMVEETTSVYDLLEHNSRMHNEFLFLMKLSMHIPKLQKHEYFLYIRDFIIGYERSLKDHFAGFNASIALWNQFIFYKNMTLLGLLLPGKERISVI